LTRGLPLIRLRLHCFDLNSLQNKDVPEIAHKKIVLGVTGGIAAYKAAELTRELTRNGFEVQVVMTEAACRFVTPETFQALSANPVFTDMWDARIRDNMAHIGLSRGKDAIVVAPASADFLAKLAHGLADDLLSTLCLARACPLIVAPAMNREMWDNPATRRNIEQLGRDGVAILGPASGDQACGEVGVGRMVEAAEIAEAVADFLAPKLLQGTRVLVTAGPTFEAIDAVRGITNQSSGKMGYSIARAAREAGASVTLVSGPTSLAPPLGIRRIDVVSARDMFHAVKKHVPSTDIYISVAAVGDYHVVNQREHKIKRSGDNLNLELAPNPDILAWVASRPRPPFCVGFAAESEKLKEHAEAKRRAKNVPLLAANLVQRAIGTDDNEITLLDDQGAHQLARAPKEHIARQLIAHVARLYKTGNHKRPLKKAR
jgi:phosphopantothenoylcysteine decarboxylase / phosphopantothenate---cysteine ligase